MNKKIKLEKNGIIGDYTLIEELGKGGNGFVWKVQRNSKNYAIKILNRSKIKEEESKNRFLQEIEALKLAKEAKISGVVELIDFSNEDFWYVMPLAIPSAKKMKTSSITEKIHLLLPLAETLYYLHMENIYHRDIKPENILYLDNKLLFADFGLVKLNSTNYKITETSKRRGLGALSTMAPEMRRSPASSNPAFADVYSFAKTIWIYLTGVEDGFDGEYHSESTQRLDKYISDFIYLEPLNKLLSKATQNNPENRPTMEVFIIEFISWSKSFFLEQYKIREDWLDVLKKLYPIGIPQYSFWINKHDIFQALINFTNFAQKCPLILYRQNSNANSLITKTISFDKNNKNLIVFRTKEILYGEKTTLSQSLDIIIKINKLEFRHIHLIDNWSYFRIEGEIVLNHDIKTTESCVLYIFSISSPYFQNSLFDKNHLNYTEEDFFSYISNLMINNKYIRLNR